VDSRRHTWLKVSQHGTRRSRGHLKVLQKQHQAHMCRHIPTQIEWILYTHVKLGILGVSKAWHVLSAAMRTGQWRSSYSQIDSQNPVQE